MNDRPNGFHLIVPAPAAIAAAVRQQILAAIRSGGFAHVAAEASGVPAELLVQWLEEGNRDDAVEPYAGFAAEVRQALAQARLAAEVSAFQKDPKVWLEHGPGKETPGNPGWTGVMPATSEDELGELNVFMRPELGALFRDVLTAMADHPEVRCQVAEVLNRCRPVQGRPRRVFWSRIA